MNRCNMSSYRTPEQNNEQTDRQRMRYGRILSGDRKMTLERNAKRKRKLRIVWNYTIREDGHIHRSNMAHACVHCGALNWLAERVFG